MINPDTSQAAMQGEAYMGRAVPDVVEDVENVRKGHVLERVNEHQQFVTVWEHSESQVQGFERARLLVSGFVEVHLPRVC